MIAVLVSHCANRLCGFYSLGAIHAGWYFIRYAFVSIPTLQNFKPIALRHLNSCVCSNVAFIRRLT